ncbi:putative oxidoreductase YjmC [bacterium YEK0313]|nr:putative oxidoreductase YjmC [bacterium YEK0313]
MTQAPRPEPAAGKIRVAVAALTDAVTRLFVAAGLGETAARTMAAALIEAERQGLASHGLMHLPLYLDRLRAGSVSAAERASLVSDLGALAVLDAGHMFGHLAADQAMALAIDKALAFGIGAVAVRRGFHFGAAGRYALQAAARGCIGMAMSNTRPMMPAPGGAEPLVGNNPLSIAVPTADAPAIVVDMATSEGALGKIRMAARAGKPIPANWAVTSEGEATTDAEAAIKGMLLPTGGPKGFALSLAIDLICGLVSGGAMSAEVQPLYGDIAKPNDCSFLFLALRVPEAAAGRADAVSERIRHSRRAAGQEPAKVPGAGKAEAGRIQRDWVDIDAAVHAAMAARG